MPSGKSSSTDNKEGLGAIVNAAAAGDRLAVNKLIRKYRQDIFRMVTILTRSSLEAEDITQDIFIKMARGIHKLRKPERFRSWLYRLAVNEVIDFHRRRKLLACFGITENVPAETTACGDANPADALLKKEFRQRLSAYLARLSRTEREVFLLRFVDGLKLREIASVLGKAESSVKTHLYRATRKFRRSENFRTFLQEYRHEG